MARPFGIAAVQMAAVPWDVPATLARMRERVLEVRQSSPEVQMVCFPELILAALADEPPPEGYKRPVETILGTVTEQLAALARESGLWLQPGSLEEQEPGGQKVYNTALVFSPQGELVARYRKLFPWQPWEENDAGQEFCVFDVPGVGRFGLSICYDLWFPEVARTLTWLGAEVILHPTLTWTRDRAQERVLNRATAIFHQCYVVDVNSIGKRYGGYSAIVDPNGRVLQEAGEGEEILAEVLDLDLVRQVREEGTVGLNQTLKQFRDTDLVFPPYAARRGAESDEAKEAFGRLGGMRQKRSGSR